MVYTGLSHPAGCRGSPDEKEIGPVYSDYLKLLVKQHPRIHVLNNIVSSSFVADALLALGAGPVMGFDPRESAEITAASDGLCLNTGTPHRGIEESYLLSLEMAAERGIPVVLDCPGVGASALRMEIARDLLAVMRSGTPSWLRIVRGNGSEILSLAAGESRGGCIDSAHAAGEALEAGRSLLTCAEAVCISGRVNHIIHSGASSPVAGGSPLMAAASGFGCISTALMTAFLAVHRNLHTTPTASAASAARAAEGVCRLMADCAGGLGEVRTPGAYKSAFIDSLYKISETINMKQESPICHQSL